MNSNKINLSGKWISSFVENNKIYNEYIKFEQKGNKVFADIKLDYDGEFYTYKFLGSISKDILNGVYTYDENMISESGVISLKIINQNLLSGVSTFTSLDGANDVIQTPYIIIRDITNNIGTFNLCTDCVGKSTNCCCDPIVDMPVLLPKEVETISKNLNIDKKLFSQIINLNTIHNDKSLKDIYQMKRNERTKACYFYKNNRCQIYNIRPIDCRIFPYDIKLEDDGNYYLVYYTSSKCYTNNEKIENIKQISYNTRLFLRLILPYIREWVDDSFITRLTIDREYKKICKIEDLF